MKGAVFRILMIVVLAIIFLLVVLPFFSSAKKSFETKEPIIHEIFKPITGYKFDEQDLIVDLSDPTVGTNTLSYFKGDPPLICDDLARCIIYSLKNNGEPCLIKKIDHNNSLPTSILSGTYPDLEFGCSNYNGNGLVTEKVGDAQRTVCSLETIPESTFYSRFEDENNTFGPYEPYIHGCYIPDDFTSLIQDSRYPYWINPSATDPDDFSLPFNVTRKYFIFSPPYYETWLSQYPYLDTGYSTTIYLSNATIGDDGECQYNIFSCSQPAIASSEDDVAFQIFEHFRTDITNDLKCCKRELATDSNRTTIYPRAYEFDFTNEAYKPNLHQIITAIDAGLWEWSKINFNNKELANIILDTNLDPTDLTADYVRFNYTPLTTYSSGGFNYPECYDFLGITQFSDLDNIFTSGEWTGKELDTSYNKVSVKSVYTFSFETITIDEANYNVLIITPYISICRDN